MAKKKKVRIPAQDFKADDTVIENGVAVSRSGRDRGSEHLLKNGRADAEDIVAQEIHTAARQGRVRISKRVDTLERMMRDKEIDQRQYDAGRDFQADFYNGHLHGYPGTRFEYVPPATGDKMPGLGMEKSRRRIAECMKDIRKTNEDVANAVWEIIGQDKSLREKSGNNPLRAGFIKAYLILGLKIIADYYRPQNKKRY